MVAGGLVVVAGVLAWLHARGANERHVTGLLNRAVADAGLDPDPLEPLEYFRETFDGECGAVDEGDRWVGSRGVKAFNPPLDHRATAAEFAAAYEADGWTVLRWEGGETTVEPGRIVHARRGEDRVRVTFSEGVWTLGAASGPCVPFLSPPDEIPTYTPVDGF